jgi:peptidoglycan hydrolase-like protein with peptidoglycan-binding domain
MVPFSVGGVLRVALVASLAFAAVYPNSAAAITAVEANDARFQSPNRSQIRASIIKIQVLLARRSISPGEIDGLDGENVRKAISEFRRQQNLPAGEVLDQTVWDALHAGGVTRATVTQAKADAIDNPVVAGIGRRPRVARLVGRVEPQSQREGP